MKRARQVATFEVLENGRSRVSGVLDFATVTELLPLGVSAIESGRAVTIDLGGVIGSDSSALALLIEWISVARQAGQPLLFENMPLQLHQLARLSEVEELLIAPHEAASAEAVPSDA